MEIGKRDGEGFSRVLVSGRVFCLEPPESFWKDA